MNLREQHVLILGLGESGLAMARWCVLEGARVHVADTRTMEHGGPPQLAAFQALLPDAAVHLGTFDAGLLNGIDLVAISPGLSPLHEAHRGLLGAAAERGIPVWGELEFFAQKLAALKLEQTYQPQVIAITGTNGKTTVTSLTGKLCERAGLKTRVAGNISPAALDALADALTKNDLPQVWVLELSSFQLAISHSFSPDAATVLNITQDHLDWHGDMAHYSAAKAKIFATDRTHSTTRILNRDDAAVMRMADSKARIISFGLDAPDTTSHAHEQFGVLQEGGMRWLAHAEANTEVPRSKRQKKLALHEGDESQGMSAPAPDYAPEPTPIKRLMPAEALQIRGDHNIANALAALALCRAIGLPMAPLLHGLREYRGEAHRVESILHLNDVEYIDDSKGTNVGATVAALQGLGNNAHAEASNRQRRIILIAGGDGKGQDFAPLAQAVARHARTVLLIGKDAPLMRAALAESDVPLHDCATLAQAVYQAAALAQRGDIVLLSPACASLDMFRDYKHRAQIFIDAVHELALEASQPC